MPCRYVPSKASVAGPVVLTERHLFGLRSGIDLSCDITHVRHDDVAIGIGKSKRGPNDADWTSHNGDTTVIPGLSVD